MGEEDRQVCAASQGTRRLGLDMDKALPLLVVAVVVCACVQPLLVGRIMAWTRKKSIYFLFG